MAILYSYMDKVICNEQAEHVVIWSGGCDSTLLLKEVAEKYGTPTKPVVAISIDHYLIDKTKTKKEKEMREKLLEEYKNRGLNILHHTITVDGNMNLLQYYTSIQSYLWLSLVMPYLKKEANLYLGFIRSDDILLHLSEFKALLGEMGKFLNRDVNLITPYMYNSKADIIQELMDCDLYDKTWYCELPHLKTEEKCGRCKPCETHQSAMIDLVLKGDKRAIPYLPKQLKYIKKYGEPKSQKLTLSNK